MNVNNYVKKQILAYYTMLAVGLIALFAGYMLDFETGAMTGIAIGFIPVGLGGILIMLYARNNPAMHRNIESEADERSSFIRNKSGASAFWVTFWYVFALSMLSNVINISQVLMGVYTLIFMAVIYFVIFFINLRKY
ncbi:MAG: hypothetical protein PHX14_10550, partial [Syntrophomonadaceae bacterium]|nr:hypothetical protein [Syntrophomonadaceae bacterium]